MSMMKEIKEITKHGEKLPIKSMKLKVKFDKSSPKEVAIKKKMAHIHK